MEVKKMQSVIHCLEKNNPFKNYLLTDSNAFTYTSLNKHREMRFYNE